MKKIDKAISLAVKAHEGQTRRRLPVPYIVHPLSVMKRLAQWGITDENILISAILHDVLEDSSFKYENLENRFGRKIALIVFDLTHYPGVQDKDTYLAEFIKKDIESLIVKIADRMDNITDFYMAESDKTLPYIEKTELLITIFNQRIEEVRKAIGGKIAGNMLVDYYNLVNKIKGK